MMSRKRGGFEQDEGGHYYSDGKNTKLDYESIYAKTLKYLREGGQQHGAPGTPQEPTPSESTCQLCIPGSRGRPLVPCSHCGRQVCDLCIRTCDGCQDVFCTACCTPNYEEALDRDFCFECDSSACNGRAGLQQRHSLKQESPVSIPPPVTPQPQNSMFMDRWDWTSPSSSGITPVPFHSPGW
mmetsp:Transcript_311/g.1041  ORF Transcript_311/g.1041 Transcript_311/m.1041 type:complete len:183 (+) Transcript_311:71-619(+)